MFLVDSDFLSQTEKDSPLFEVVRWFERTPAEATFISVMTLSEIQTGLELMPNGQRRAKLTNWLEQKIMPDFAARTIDIDTAIARESGRLLADAKLRGYTASLGDGLIAATAKVHGLRVATLNRKHFLQLGVLIVDL